MPLPIYQQIPGTGSYELSNLRYVAVSLTQLFLGDEPMFLQRLNSLQPEDFGVNYGRGQSAFVDSGMLYEINPLLRRI
ncbi:MAG: hypothetical protein Q7K45_05235, partial [Nanoarchaeota archaeon]|nr:hypothetical protein [Nanoarchaeota archaeon]